MAKKKSYVATYGGSVDYSKQYQYPKGTQKDPTPKVKQKKVVNKQRVNRISLGGSKNKGYPLGTMRRLNEYAQRYKNVKKLQVQGRVNAAVWDTPAPKFMPNTQLGDAVKYPTMADPWSDVPKSVNMTDIKSWSKPKSKMVSGLGAKGKKFSLGVLRSPLAIAGALGGLAIGLHAQKGINKRKKKAQEAIRAAEEAQKRKRPFGRKRKERSDKGKKRGKYRT